MPISPSKVFDGISYIGRIKDPKHLVNIHAKRDLLHAVIYEDPSENLDFLDVKAMIDEKNGLIFYTNLMDRERKETFTWKQCQDAVKNKPPVGQICVSFHDKPLSFAKFLELGYEQGILHEPETLANLQSILYPPVIVAKLPVPSGPAAERSLSSQDAVRHGIASAISMSSQFDPASLPQMSSSSMQLINPNGSSVDVAGAPGEVASNLVIGDIDLSHGELSREFWQSRALTAESRAGDLEGSLAQRDDEILDLKSKLLASENAKERFRASADLASVAVRENQAHAVQPIIEGLKPELSILPKIKEDVKILDSKVAALEGLPAMVVALQQAFDASNERSVLADDDRARDSETVICFHNRMIKLLSQFGISVDSPTFDIPKAVSLLLSKSNDASKVAQPLPIVSLTCDCGCGGAWKTLDTSQPPPPVMPSSAPSVLFPAPPPQSAGPGSDGQTSATPVQHSTFLLDPTNNNPPPRGYLMHHPPGSFITGHQGSGQPPAYVSPYPPAHGSGNFITGHHGSVQAPAYVSPSPPAHGTGNFLPGHQNQPAQAQAWQGIPQNLKRCSSGQDVQLPNKR